MGRKKNLAVLKERLAYVEGEVKELDDFQGADLHKLDALEDERVALEWALRKLEAEEICVADRVRLHVYPDKPSVQPEQGEVIGHTAGGYLIRPFTGEYAGTKTGLWYSKDQVWLVDP
jgi:hypothetical protein